MARRPDAHNNGGTERVCRWVQVFLVEKTIDVHNSGGLARDATGRGRATERESESSKNSVCKRAGERASGHASRQWVRRQRGGVQEEVDNK